MSAMWQIDNTYFKIHLDSSGTPELFNIASCENYFAYWDSLDSNANLYVYNIPNNFTKVSNVYMTFPDYSRTSELRLDINKNGVCFFFIDGKIGLFGDFGINIISNITYDLSYTRVAIGTNKGFIKYKDIDNTFKIQYFDINNAIVNNEIVLNDFFTGDIIIDQFTVLSIYHNDLVIGSSTSNSGHGVIKVYDDTLINPTTFSFTQAITFFGFQISTSYSQIIVRSFRSITHNTTDNIPIFIYTKTNGVYTRKTQYTVNKLSQVFICQTTDNLSYYITNTYEHGNLDRRINIYNENNENSTVFFNGNPNNKSFSMPTNNYFGERRDITTNDTFLFVRTNDCINIFAHCFILSFPNKTDELLPIDSNILLYNKKGGNTVYIDNDSVCYDFSSNYFNPHKFYVSNDFLANRTYDTIKLIKYVDGFIDSSLNFSIDLSPIQHNFFDNQNNFNAYNVDEFYLNETLHDNSNYKYNKFELFFNGEANIDEWEFIMFSNKDFFNINESSVTDTNILYAHLDISFSDIIFSDLSNNSTSTNIGSTEWLIDGDHICEFQRPYSRANGENPMYDNVSIELIKECRNFHTLLHKENSVNNSKSKKSLNIDGMSRRKFNELNKFKISNNKCSFFSFNNKPTYSNTGFNTNYFIPVNKKCYNL